MTKATPLYFNDEKYDLPQQASDATSMGGQLARIVLNVQINVSQYTKKIPYKFVVVSLDGTSVAASDVGRMAFDRDDLKGWFTESVIVTMGLYSLPGARIQQNKPENVMGSVNTTSSTGLSIDENAGSFGPTPTVGVGGGLTIGHSISANIADFSVQNDSSDTQVVHRYLLASTSAGAYNSPKDLLDESGEALFHGFPLVNLPQIAISNLPIISQAIFLAPPDAGDSPFTIHIRHTRLKVEKGNFDISQFGFPGTVNRRTWEPEWSYNVPLSQVSAD